MTAWMRTKKTADYFGVAESTIRRWTQQHGLPVHRIGGTNLYDSTELDKWARQFRAAQMLRRHRMAS